MTKFGYTLMTERSGPKDLVQYAISAEDRGFAGSTVIDARVTPVDTTIGDQTNVGHHQS
jgi:hypothetical protein